MIFEAGITGLFVVYEVVSKIDFRFDQFITVLANFLEFYSIFSIYFFFCPARIK